MFFCSKLRGMKKTHMPSTSFTYQQMHFISLYKPLKFTLELKLKLLLHVSVYDHHQGACTWA